MSTSDSTQIFLNGTDQLAASGQSGAGAATNSQGALLNPRGSTYGEFFMHSPFGSRGDFVSAREGSRWVVSNTQGTAIVDSNPSGFVATTPTMVIVNNNPVGGAWIYPLALSGEVVAVGASSTNWLGQWLIDSGNRYTSGGTALTPQACNINVLNGKTGALVYFGAITAPAANASRVIDLHFLRVSIPVTGDTFSFEFGGTGTQSTASTPATIEAVYRKVTPVAIAPQSSLLWYQWGASEGTARSFDNVNFQYAER
jgi:hypothetical protein